MILNGDISAVDLLETILERVEKINPDLNAIITLNRYARNEAEEADKLAKKGVYKPLLGVPLTIKDNIYTSGLKTTFGSLLYKDFIPDEDAIVVKRIRDAGAVIIGKTNLPEFGLVAITDNPLFGPTRNPWDRDRTPGGSSGGSAAAVAAGLGPISIGMAQCHDILPSLTVFICCTISRCALFDNPEYLMGSVSSRIFL